MKKYIRFLTLSFVFVAVLCITLYFAITYFESKVKEEYSLLLNHSQKMLQVFLDQKNGDLYLLCILDYHLNPNGKNMLSECSKIENVNIANPHINTKLETPYYDFYMKYIQGI